MKLVRLGAADIQSVIELWERAGLQFRPTGRDSEESFANQLRSDSQAVLAYKRGDELLGAIVVTHDGRKGWLNRLAVDPACRRQGIGTMLITAAERHLESLGIQVFAALIYKSNQESIATFSQAGYDCSPDVLYFSKRLDPGA